MADGREENVLLHAAEGEGVGTYFVPGHQTMNGKKPWLVAVRQPVGVIRIDVGAAHALQQPDGASLLPRGIVGVTGAFERGDLVSVVAPRGEVARGLVNYSCGELRQIMGRHSREIPAVLGHEGPEEAIHRDNLVLTSD